MADPNSLTSWQHHATNPFANPHPAAVSPSPSADSSSKRWVQYPTIPPPTTRDAAAANVHPHIEPRNLPARPPPAACATPHKSSSMSSVGDGSTLVTPMPSVDLEKRSLEQQDQENKRSSRNSSKRSKRSPSTRDPEKAIYCYRNGVNHRDHSPQYDEDEDEECDGGIRMQEKHALKILLFLSGPCALMSTISALWAILALIITALTQPVRLCARRPSFGQQLGGLLGPTLNLQLRCIYTPLPPHANEDGSYYTFMLVLTHLVSPLLAFVMIFAAWTVAIYWASSAIVGDPAGQDKRDDGKETVLGLRRWWERWLIKSIADDHDKM